MLPLVPPKEPWRSKHSYCYSNAECESPGQSCVFIDSDMEPIEARTKCESCTTRPLCMMPRGSSVGQCACGLRELEFARCRPEDVGNLIALPFSKMCVMQADARYSASVTYTAEYSESSVTPHGGGRVHFVLHANGGPAGYSYDRVNPHATVSPSATRRGHQ